MISHLEDVRAEVAAGKLAPHRALDELDARWRKTLEDVATSVTATPKPLAAPKFGDKPRLADIPLTEIGTSTLPDGRSATVYKMTEDKPATPTVNVETFHPKHPPTPEQQAYIEAETKTWNRLSMEAIKKVKGE